MATFHADQNVPRALAEELRQRGHTVFRAVELGLFAADDPRIFYARRVTGTSS